MGHSVSSFIVYEMKEGEGGVKFWWITGRLKGFSKIFQEFGI